MSHIRVYVVQFKDGKKATALDMHQEPEKEFCKGVRNLFGPERVKSIKRQK